MQIDFHHGVTYVLARLAGFSHDEAQIIAHSAQYVDDAVDDGTLFFDNEGAYEFISSAHKMLDYRNFSKLANHHVWIPFHFLPGNDLDPKLRGKVPDFVQQAICRPNSVTAREMVARAIFNRDHQHALYRLGITMHVYADTWAHQGFAGIVHPVNTVKEILDHEGRRDETMHQRLEEYFEGNWWEKVLDALKSKVVSDLSPLGHGAVLSYPDRPYLNWQYRDWQGQLIRRDNPSDFLQAAEHMHTAMVRFHRGDPNATVMPMHKQDRDKIDELLRSCRQEDGNQRHRVWLEQIAAGAFSFGPQKVEYIEAGPGSWLNAAFPDMPRDRESLSGWLEERRTEIPFTKEFMDSHWKLFHDAVLCHRIEILHHILPQQGLLAA